jgi:ribosomal protein S18 acetylase RimI-like enzyme
MAGSYRIVPLVSEHNRQGFQCGVSDLDDYFRLRVTQDIRRHVTACYVAIDTKSANVAGFYTLSAGGIALADMPDHLAKRLPRYPLVPVARLGRLAVDRRYQGRKLGAALLWDAAVRSAKSEVAVYALAVDAKDERAIAFYEHHGFIVFGDAGNHMFLPLANLR